MDATVVLSSAASAVIRECDGVVCLPYACCWERSCADSVLRWRAPVERKDLRQNGRRIGRLLPLVGRVSFSLQAFGLAYAAGIGSAMLTGLY